MVKGPRLMREILLIFLDYVYSVLTKTWYKV